MSDTDWKVKLASDGTGFVGTVTIPPAKTEEEQAAQRRKAIEDGMKGLIGSNEKLTAKLKPLIDLLAGNQATEFKGFGEKIDKLLNALLLDKDKKFRFGIADFGFFKGFQEGFAENQSKSDLGGILDAFKNVLGLDKKTPKDTAPTGPLTQPRYLPVTRHSIFGGLLGDYGTTYANPTKAPDAVPPAIPKLDQFAEALNKAGKTIGKTFAGAMKGQEAAQAVKPLTNLLGLKSSKTGAQIGGALGSVTGIPGMDIIGGILGSVVGGLFKKTKSGSVSIGIGADGLEVGGATGTNKVYREVATGLGKSVVGGLSKIAETFGGFLSGTPSVSIGKRGDDFRVDPTGRGKTKVKHGAVDFGEDQAAAVAYAISDALKDGVITGLSDAVKKALASSTDLDVAIKEATKVADLELLLGGIQVQLKKAFIDFEKQAADRVRVARKYGFDLVQLEELNTRQRAKAFEEAVNSRVGTLQAFLKDIGTGSLAEGSLVEQRDKLLVEIAKAKTNAETGVEGAAAELAELQRRLLEISREAFGTGSTEYAGDRAGAVSAAEKVIEIEKARIKEQQDAAKAAQDKLDTGNALANEANNLLAQQLAVLRQLGLSTGSAGTPGLGGGAFNTQRQVAL